MALGTVKKRIRMCGRPAVPNISAMPKLMAEIGSLMKPPGPMMEKPSLAATSGALPAAADSCVFTFTARENMASGLKRRAAGAGPRRQRRARRVHARAGVDGLLPVVRQMVCEVADQRVRHQPAGRDAAVDHVGLGRLLHQLLAAAAGPLAVDVSVLAPMVRVRADAPAHRTAGTRDRAQGRRDRAQGTEIERKGREIAWRDARLEKLQIELARLNRRKSQHHGGHELTHG